MARTWSVVFLPAAVPLAHGAAGVWDEVFNLIAVGVVLVVLGVIIFSRKPTAQAPEEPTELAESQHATEAAEEDRQRSGLRPRKPQQ